MVAVVAAVALVSAGTVTADASGAKHPKPFSSNKIVVQKSMGGIKLNSSESTVNKFFGHKACTNGGCSYLAKNNAYSVSVQFAMKTQHSKPYAAVIEFFSSSFAKAARKLKTDKGIGIGSTVKALKKAYKHLKGSESQGGYYLGSDPHLTSFAVYQGRVEDIRIQNTDIG